VTSPGTPGALPPLDWVPVPTPWYKLARPDIGLTVATCSIATISGPSGTGKTTTVVACARQEDIDLRYTALNYGANTKDVVVGLHEALHGPRRGSPRDGRTLRRDIVNTLAAGGRGVIADEVHYSGTGGMLTLAQLWERVKVLNGRGFPLFLVGATVQDAISKSDELYSRVEFPIRIDILGEQSILDAVRQISDRCRATPAKRLLAFDNTIGHGNLRQWSHFIRHVHRDPRLAGEAITPFEMKAYVARRRATSRSDEEPPA
jgi:hypothetical protein